MSEPEMCNPEKPKRKFWQVHLSTAVILMIEAAGLLWLNVTHVEEKRTLHYPLYFEGSELTNVAALFERQGWPICYHQVFFQGTLHDRMNPDDRVSDDWKALSLTIDAVICLVILLANGSICEWLIRRREGRKP